MKRTQELRTAGPDATFITRLRHGTARIAS